jgi:hypothetical protein
MYWSFGKTKEAEDAIKAAVASGKLSSPDEAKVALGHVLLTQGKNQDAATTFSSVPKASKEANIARLWSIYARHPEPATAGAEKAAAPARRKG